MNMNKVNSEEATPYATESPETEARNINDATIAHALSILRDRMLPKNAPTLSSPEQTRAFLNLELGELDYESFCILHLDQQHRVLKFEHLFRGTLTQGAVYPREVLKATLDNNSAAVIFAHNHPSGVPKPSGADDAITERLKEALALIDVRVLDHIIIGGADSYSYAEQGKL